MIRFRADPAGRPAGRSTRVASPPPRRRTSAERCRSGRTGRSRKPLCAQAYRGFESHPLRHFLDQPTDFVTFLPGRVMLLGRPALRAMRARSDAQVGPISVTTRAFFSYPESPSSSRVNERFTDLRGAGKIAPRSAFAGRYGLAIRIGRPLLDRDAPPHPCRDPSRRWNGFGCGTTDQ